MTATGASAGKKRDLIRVARALLPASLMNPTLRGIGIRAIVLLVGIVLVAAWLLSLALDIVGAAIQLLLWLGLILIAAGALALAVRRLRRKS